jgi:hypothetical protein
MTAAYSNFCGWRLGPLGLLDEVIYQCQRAAEGPTPGPGAARGRLRHPMVWPPPGSAPSLLWTPSSCQVNRNFGFCFVQFREYFLYNFSEIQK